MISNFDDFLEEGKVTVKRRYTENYPSKHVYSGAKIRNSVLSAIKDGVVTKEEFQKILDEAGASRVWKYKYEHFFDINEDGIKLSTKGLRICPVEKIEEASTSIAQQRLMGIAYALKTGEIDPEDASDEAKDLAQNLTVKQLKDFASTKHKGLPYKKENESITPAEIHGMGSVSLPGNPGTTTSFDNQKVGSGDIPIPITNKKKIKIMKLIPESFEEFKQSLIVEAFNSSILQSLSQNPKGNIGKKFFDTLSKMGIAISDVTDDQILEITPAEAKKYTASFPNAILIYYSTTQKENPYAGRDAYGEAKVIGADVPLAVVKDKLYMGLAYDKWASKNSKAEYKLVKAADGTSLGIQHKDGSSYSSGLTSLDKMASVSDVVYVIIPTVTPSSTEKRLDRSKSRQGATAYINDKDFKSANMARYNSILADQASKLPLDKDVADAIDIVATYIKDAITSDAQTKYGEILVGLDPRGREIRMSSVAYAMKNLLDDFERYSQAMKNSKEEGSKYYAEQSKQYAKSIVDGIRKIKNKDLA